MNRLIASFLFVPAALSLGTAAEKPNVPLIVVDDMNWKLGCYGNDVGHSPNLDLLAVSP